MALFERISCYTRLEKMEGKYLEAALRYIHWGGNRRTRCNVFGVQVAVLLPWQIEAEV